MNNPADPMMLVLTLAGRLRKIVNSINSSKSLFSRTTFVKIGVEFIDENGGGPGVRLRKRQQKKG